MLILNLLLLSALVVLIVSIEIKTLTLALGASRSVLKTPEFDS